MQVIAGSFLLTPNITLTPLPLQPSGLRSAVWEASYNSQWPNGSVRLDECIRVCLGAFTQSRTRLRAEDGKQQAELPQVAWLRLYWSWSVASGRIKCRMPRKHGRFLVLNEISECQGNSSLQSTRSRLGQAAGNSRIQICFVNRLVQTCQDMLVNPPILVFSSCRGGSCTPCTDPSKHPVKPGAVPSLHFFGLLRIFLLLVLLLLILVLLVLLLLLLPLAFQSVTLRHAPKHTPRTGSAQAGAGPRRAPRRQPS